MNGRASLFASKAGVELLGSAKDNMRFSLTLIPRTGPVSFHGTLRLHVTSAETGICVTIGSCTEDDRAKGLHGSGHRLPRATAEHDPPNANRLVGSTLAGVDGSFGRLELCITPCSLGYVICWGLEATASSPIFLCARAKTTFVLPGSCGCC